MSELAWIRHPREATTFDKILSRSDPVFNDGLGPWTNAIQKFNTTSLPITGGAGANEATMVVGHFPQMVFGTRTTGVQIRILDAGSVTDTDGVTINAADQLMRLVVAHLRADVQILRPSWFTALTGVLQPED